MGSVWNCACSNNLYRLWKCGFCMEITCSNKCVDSGSMCSASNCDHNNKSMWTVEVCVLHRTVLTIISLCGQLKYVFCVELCSQ